jgi:hypothetical protein
MFRQIPIKLPGAFEAALGYRRGLKWVAFYWEPCGDEAMYDDGICSGDGHWWGFLQFVRHRKVAPWLRGYDLGSSDSEAIDWLLCDLENRDIYVGRRREVASFLSGEARGDRIEPVADVPAEEIRDILARIHDFMKEVPAPSMEEIQEKIRQDQEAVAAMVAELG